MSNPFYNHPGARYNFQQNGLPNQYQQQQSQNMFYSNNQQGQQLQQLQQQGHPSEQGVNGHWAGQHIDAAVRSFAQNAIQDLQNVHMGNHMVIPATDPGLPMMPPPHHSASPTAVTLQNLGSSKRRSKQPSKKKHKKEEEYSDDELDYLAIDGTRTKSGREIHRPNQFNPTAKERTARRKSGNQWTKLQRNVHICIVCQREHSPKSNRIVFCDGCDSPYHQLCHDPPIPEMIIDLEDTEWFCSTCEGKRAQQPLVTGASGKNLTEEQKKTYLACLPSSHLVELLLFCERQHPDLKFYAPNVVEMLDEMHRQKAEAQARQEEEEAARARIMAELPLPGTPAPAAIAEEGSISGADELPSYDEMVMVALRENAQERPLGMLPKEIFDWMAKRYPLQPKFRASANQGLQRNFRAGRVEKNDSLYRVNSDYVENPLDLKSQRRVKAYRPSHLSGEIYSRATEDEYVPLPGRGTQLDSDDSGIFDMMIDEDGTAFTHAISQDDGRTNSADVVMQGHD